MTNDELTREHQRFLALFDRTVRFTREGVAATPTEKLSWWPSGGDAVKFGDRLTNVTIRSLFTHLVVSEHTWARMLRDCEDGALIDAPRDPDLAATLEGDDFIEVAAATHEVTMQILRSYSLDNLRKPVEFTRRTWSVMGLLWAIYGHHNYHLGNIDMYWRMSGCEPKDYFNFEPPDMP